MKSALARRRQWLHSLLPRGPSPAILMYHRIAEEPFDPWGLSVTPANFRDQLAWLAQNRTVLPLGEFAALHRAGTLPAEAIAVTLDDGYACASKIAAPLLEQFGVPATIFVPVELIEGGEPFWWDELEEMILEDGAGSLSVDGQEFPLGKRSPADRHWKRGSRAATPRQSAFEQIHSRLSRKRPSELKKTMAELRRQTKRMTAFAKRRPMTPEEVRRTRSSTVEFGSHSLTHPWLTKLGRAAQQREIGDSLVRLEKLCGSRPTAFAYPYGIFDQLSEKLAAEAGFECACATWDVALSRRSRLFALPRVHVRDGGASDLGRRLARVRAV